MWHTVTHLPEPAAAGGGVLDLVAHVNGCGQAGALHWLADAGLIGGATRPPPGAAAEAESARIRRNRPWRRRSAPEIVAEARCNGFARAIWYLGFPRNPPRAALSHDNGHVRPTSPTVHIAAILAAAVPADGTPGALTTDTRDTLYLATRGT